MGGTAFSWRTRASWLLLVLAACSGGGFDALPGTAGQDGSRDGDDPNAGDPSAPQPDDSDTSVPPTALPPSLPPLDAQPGADGGSAADRDLCRFLVVQNDGAVAVTYADGSARSVARADALAHELSADVATIGSYAIVGIAAADFAGDPTLMFLHAERGALWQGTQPNPSDYTRAMGFMSITREGFALLNDGSVLDALGAQHDVPEAGFAAVVANIDAEGFILVGDAGQLAYWDVAGDRIDRAPTEGVGRAIVAPLALGGIEGREVAFLEDRGGGAMAFTRLSRDEVARLDLPPAAAQLAQSELDKAELGELWIQSDGYDGDAALLSAGGRPLAWLRAGRAPLAIDGGAQLPAGTYLRIGGGCFTSTATSVVTADELLASTWRVSAQDGSFEKGLRFSIPSGLTLEVPLGGATYPLPLCVGDGRMAVVLRGPDGVAWFAEGGSALEQLTTWTAEVPEEPAQAHEQPLIPAADRRIISTWNRPNPPDRCELRYTADGTTLIDHERGVDHFVPGFAAVAWLDDAEPTR